MGKPQEKVAFITGSDSGIGQATAIEFAREGADVVAHYLHDEQGANSTREQVEAQGRPAIVVRATTATKTRSSACSKPVRRLRPDRHPDEQRHARMPRVPTSPS
jgi:NAD(P)-dependent dehydrogenase (short-subunit alcohol dehydrogenase family)